MYKLLLVDDEIELIEGLKTLIDWNEYGIDICGDTDNGLSAWEMINELQPDIMLVDIRMPIMNGLELLEKMNQSDINIKCIILSGYDDFYYAQKAMDLKAQNYLLKPCRPDDILQSVLKVKDALDNERSRDTLLKTFRQQFQENLPVLKEKLLSEIISGKAADFSMVNEKIKLYDIKLASQNMVCVLLRIDSVNSLYGQYSGIDIETLKIAVAHISEDILSPSFAYELFQYGDDIVCIISIQNDNDYTSLIVSILESLKDQIKNRLDITVTLGVSNRVTSIEKLWMAYKEALSAVESKFFLGEDNVIIFNDITLSNGQPSSYPLDEETEIINCLSTGNDELIRDKVSSFFKHLNTGGTASKNYLKKASIALIGRIYKFCIEININTEELFGEQLTIFDEIQMCETNSELQERILSILSGILKKISEQENKNFLVKSAVEYIKNNYSNDIDLETIAKQIYITPGYLSLLFKQEMGINFLDFLHKYRIQKAKEFLKNRFLKNYEVACMVGYNDEKYFSRMFKRHTGITPTQYKESLDIY